MNARVGSVVTVRRHFLPDDLTIRCRGEELPINNYELIIDNSCAGGVLCPSEAMNNSSLLIIHWFEQVPEESILGDILIQKKQNSAEQKTRH